MSGHARHASIRKKGDHERSSMVIMLAIDPVQAVHDDANDDARKKPK